MRPWRVLVLLNNDRQVHSLMDRTIDVIGACGAKWSDLRATAIDLHVVDARGAWLTGGFGDAILPGAIGQDVQSRDIIYKRELRTFGYGDRRLEKTASTHVHGWHAVGVGRTCSQRFLRDGADENGADDHACNQA